MLRAIALASIVFAVIVFVTGCGRTGDADAVLIAYQQQLAQALELPAPEPQKPANIAAFPDQRDRVFEIPDTRESIQNVYALRECNITSLVAKRNNQLGRVAVPSQHWLYELELWRRLSHCLNSDIAKALPQAHRHRLERLTETKTRQLPWVSWNALFGSEEWTGSFSRASRPLSPSEMPDIGPFLAALDYLREGALRQFDREWRPESSTLSDHLQTLRREPLTAQILRSLQLASLRLDETNQLLETALTERLCLDPAATADASAPAYIEALDRYAERWLTAIEALLDAHPVSLPAIDHYRQEWLSIEHERAPWQRFRHARLEHQRLLRELQLSCAFTEVHEAGGNGT